MEEVLQPDKILQVMAEMYLWGEILVKCKAFNDIGLCMADAWRQEMFAKLEIWILSNKDLDCDVQKQVEANRIRYGWGERPTYSMSMFTGLPEGPVVESVDWSKFSRGTFESWKRTIESTVLEKVRVLPVRPRQRSAMRAAYREATLGETKREEIPTMFASVNVASVGGMSTERDSKIIEAKQVAQTMMPSMSGGIFGPERALLEERIILAICAQESPNGDVLAYLKKVVPAEFSRKREIAVPADLLSEVVEGKPVVIEFAGDETWKTTSALVLVATVAESPLESSHVSDLGVLAKVREIECIEGKVYASFTNAWSFSISVVLDRGGGQLSSPRYNTHIGKLVARLTWLPGLEINEVIME